MTITVQAPPLANRSARDELLVTMNRLMGRFRRVGWLLGEGRSGTTWLASLVDADRRSRHVFEPFHPKRTPELSDLMVPYLYVRPGTRQPLLERIMERVFTGRLHSPRTASSHRRLLYDGLLVKDIFANLLVPWVHQQLPDVRKVLLLRHPVAVARSKLQLDDWYWAREPADLLKQDELMEDHLSPFDGVLASGSSQLQKYVVMWCVSTLVPLRAFRPGELHVVFYENLRHHLERDLAPLLDYLGRPPPSPDALARVVGRPSRTSRLEGGRALVAPTDPAQGIDPVEFRRAMNSLDAFGLTGLYGGSPEPDPSVAAGLLAHDFTRAAQR